MCVFYGWNESNNFFEAISKFRIPGMKKIPKESKSRLDGGKYPSNNLFEISISEKEEFEDQVDDVMTFLNEHSNTIAEISKIAGTSLALDFPIYNESLVCNLRIPINLIHAASKAACEIEFSIYPTSE